MSRNTGDSKQKSKMRTAARLAAMATKQLYLQSRLEPNI